MLCGSRLVRRNSAAEFSGSVLSVIGMNIGNVSQKEAGIKSFSQFRPCSFSILPVLLFLRFPGALADDIARTVLDLHVDLADVLAQDAEADELHAGDKADDTCGACPAFDRVAAESGNQRPENADKAQQRHEHSESGDQMQRLDRIRKSMLQAACLPCRQIQPILVRELKSR